MNIAVIAHAHYPIIEPFAGGLETHTYQLVTELNKMGNHVTLYAKAESDTSLNVVPIFKGDAHGGKAPSYESSYVFAMRHIAANDYDLIINNNLHWMPLRMHTASMPPMITIFHTPPFPELAEELNRDSGLANRVYSAVSELTAEQWQQFTKVPIEVVANGIDTNDWEYSLERPKYNSAAWMGRITSEKGTHIAIEACRKLGLPLTIGGAIYDQQYFDQKIQPYLEDKLITFKGHVDAKEMNNIYMRSTVALTTPLWMEPFGLVAIEAFAAGTPVATLNNGSLPLIVTKQVGAVAKKNTATSFAQAIKQAMQKDRADCRNYVEEKYTLQAMVQGYLDLIDIADNNTTEATSRSLWQTQ